MENKKYEIKCPKCWQTLGIWNQNKYPKAKYKCRNCHKSVIFNTETKNIYFERVSDRKTASGYTVLSDGYKRMIKL